MLNASVGVQRVIGRLRRPRATDASGAGRSRLRSHAAAHQVRRGLHSIVAASRLVPAPRASWPRHVVDARPLGDAGARCSAGSGHDRAVAIAVAGILVGGLGRQRLGRTARLRDTAARRGDGPGPRIAVGGAAAADRRRRPTSGDDSVRVGQRRVRADPDRPTSPADPDSTLRRPVGGSIEPEAPVSVEGPFIDDGTLVKPVAVDTTVPDGSDLVRRTRSRPATRWRDRASSSTSR